MVKSPPANARDIKDAGLIPGWEPTPVFLPGEFHGQRMWSIALQRVRHAHTLFSTNLNC